MTTHPIGLPELIRQHQDQTGHSYQDIATATGLSKAKVGQLVAAKQPHMPRAETLAKLAAGLRLPAEVVHNAALVSSGVRPQGASDDRISLLAARIRELPADDVDTVEVIVGALAARANRG